jgi:hypothetical protein
MTGECCGGWGWVCKTKSVPAVVEMGEVRSRSERWTTVLRGRQDHVAGANAFPFFLRPVRWLM